MYRLIVYCFIVEYLGYEQLYEHGARKERCLGILALSFSLSRRDRCCRIRALLLNEHVVKHEHVAEYEHDVNLYIFE